MKTSYSRSTQNRTNNNRSDNGRNDTRRHDQPRDSSRPGNTRVNPREMHLKYLNLAREAFVAGNHVQAEEHYQHAEHYYRVMNERNSYPQVQQTYTPPAQQTHAAPIQQTMAPSMPQQTPIETHTLPPMNAPQAAPVQQTLPLIDLPASEPVKPVTRRRTVKKIEEDTQNVTQETSSVSESPIITIPIQQI